MIYQTDTTFTSDVNHFGCFLFCHLYLANKYGGWDWTIDSTKQALSDLSTTDIVVDGKTVKILGDQIYVNSPQAVLDYLSPGKFKFQGHEGMDYLLQPGDAIIQNWQTPQFSHFVVGSSLTDVEYDPIEFWSGGKGSHTVAVGKIVGYRISQLEG
jgi:hypothetical protein